METVQITNEMAYEELKRAENILWLSWPYKTFTKEVITAIRGRQRWLSYQEPDKISSWAD